MKTKRASGRSGNPANRGPRPVWVGTLSERMTVAQVAQGLSLSVATVNRMVRTGALKSARDEISGWTVIPKGSVVSYVLNNGGLLFNMSVEDFLARDDAGEFE